MKKPSKKEVLNIPNAMSATGFGMVAAGSAIENDSKALALTAAGRSLDLIDGAVARKLNQESDFGAGVDAILDKLGMAAMVAGGVYHKRIPKWSAGVVIAHNSLNATASVLHEINSQETARPSKLGKIGLFAENIGLMSYMASSALESRGSNRLSKSLKIAGHVLTISGAALGTAAGVQYIKRAKNQL